MVKYLLAALLVFGFVATIYAAPVGLTSEADVTESKLWQGKDFGLNVSVITDIVNKRKIDIDSGEFEMTAPIGRIGLSMIDRYLLYMDLGAALDMEYGYIVEGAVCNTEFDDAVIWGVGVSALLYRWNNGLEIGLNGSYRRADLELETSTVEGITYKRDQLTNITDGDFQEYQGAAEVAWKTDYLTPYIGVKVSEVEVDAIFTLVATRYDANSKNAAENLGVFGGCTFTPKIAPLEGLAINVEGRVLDEEAFSVGACYRF